MAEKKASPLHDSRLKEAESERIVYRAIPSEGTPLEACLEIDYWAHVAKRFRPTTIIEVIPDGMSYYAELLVVSCGANWARVKLLRKVILESAESVIEDVQTHEIKWAGPAAKYRVIRLSDKAVIRDGFEGKEDAATWLAGHKKTIAA